MQEADTNIFLKGYNFKYYNHENLFMYLPL